MRLFKRSIMEEILNVSTLQVPGFEAELAKSYHVHTAAADGVVPAEARNVRALFTSGTNGAPQALLAQLPKLEFIANVGVGYDAIDVPAAVSRRIRISNTPDVLTDDAADLALALMLMAGRRLAIGDRDVRGGGWKSKTSPLGIKVSGKKLGILGLGRIGRAFAQRAAALGMEISYTNRNKADVPYRFIPDILTLAKENDFLVLAASAGPDAKHIVNRAVLEALGPQGILINIARGSLVDEAELTTALEEGRLGGAALDVFENEPHVPPALRAIEHVVLSPHVGSATSETRIAMGRLAMDNMSAFFAGRPLLTEVPESVATRKA